MTQGGDICVRFAYHMFGAQTGTLRVTTSSGRLVFEESGLNEDSWTEIQRDILITRGEQVHMSAVNTHAHFICHGD